MSAVSEESPPNDPPDLSARHRRLVWAGLLVWAFWLSIEYLAFGRWSYALLFDFGDSFIPYYLSEDRQGFWSLTGGWEPRMLAGLDSAANTISQFRLTNLLSSIMPLWLAVGLITFVQRAVAAVFMYRLVVDVAGGRSAIAFAIAAVFAVGIGPVGAESDFGFTHNMGFGPCFLPLLLWMHWRYALDRPWLAALLYFVLGTLIAIATMFFIAVFALLTFGLIVAASTPVAHWWRLLPGMMALGFGYLLAEFPNVIALGADWPDVHRLQNPPIPAADRWQTMLNALTELAVSNAVAVLAVTLGLIFARKTPLFAPMAAVLVVCLAILALDGVVASMVPENATLMNFSFCRISFTLPFILLFAAAIALSGLAKNSRQLTVSILTAGLLLTAVALDAKVKFANLRYYSHGSTYAVMYDQAPMQQVAALQGKDDPFRVATLYVKDVTHLNRSSFPWGYGLETVDGYVNAYPRRYQEFWVELIAGVKGKVEFDYEKMRDWGNHLYLIAPGPDCRAVTLEESANLNMLSLLNARFVVSPCPLKDDRLRLFAENRDGPGQKWHDLSNREKFLSIFRNEFPSREIYIYENLRVLPRYFLVSGARLFGKPADALKALGQANLRTLQRQVFVARSDAPADGLPGPGASDAPPGEIKILSAERGEITLAVDTPRPGIVVAANNYNKRWTATVNGAAAPLFRANHTLQAVVVGAGRSEIVLKYRTALSKLIGR